MGPKDLYSGLPSWESDFWQDLVRDYGTDFGLDEDVEVEATEPSRFDNGNVIQGEIVEDEPLGLPATGGDK